MNAFHMKKINEEWRLIVDDIIYKKHKYPLKTLHIFLIGHVGIGKIFTLMCIIQNMLRYYIRDISNVDPLKPKIMKLTYTEKTTFNINAMNIIQHLQFL